MFKCRSGSGPVSRVDSKLITDKDVLGTDLRLGEDVEAGTGRNASAESVPVQAPICPKSSTKRRRKCQDSDVWLCNFKIGAFFDKRGRVPLGVKKAPTCVNRARGGDGLI